MRRDMSINKKRNGFTLLEIMVAMIVLAILAAGFFNTMVSSRYLVARSKRRFLATEIARQEIENKRQFVRVDTWYWNNASNPLNPNGSWPPWVAAANNSGILYESRFMVQNMTAPIECRKITVQVRWNETGV